MSLKFDNLTRIGEDNCGLSQQNIQNKISSLKTFLRNSWQDILDTFSEKLFHSK